MRVGGDNGSRKNGNTWESQVVLIMDYPIIFHPNPAFNLLLSLTMSARHRREASTLTSASCASCWPVRPLRCYIPVCIIVAGQCSCAGRTLMSGGVDGRRRWADGVLCGAGEESVMGLACTRYFLW
jgi:hypothetical protein